MSFLPQTLVGTLRRLSTNTYTITRTAAGNYGESAPPSDGRFVPGPTTTLTMRASIQPMGGRDLMYLPEGLRTEQLIRIYTDTLLQTASAPNGASADLIQYGADTYEVRLVEDWAESGKFFKAVAAKVGQ